jgi:hypothetical protein
MEWKLPEGLKPTQYLMVLCAENAALMKYSLSRMANGPSTSANHLNQTNRRHGSFSVPGRRIEPDSAPDLGDVRGNLRPFGLLILPSDTL